jgi:hypothetical protein
MTIGPIYDAMHCHLCGKIIHIFGNVMWCDDCIDEFHDGDEPMDVFIERKKSEAGIT